MRKIVQREEFLIEELYKMRPKTASKIHPPPTLPHSTLASPVHTHGVAVVRLTGHAVHCSRQLPWTDLFHAHSIVSDGVHQFSRAAVAKQHKPGGFKQHKCMLSPFWRQRSQISLSAGLAPSGASAAGLSLSLWCQPAVFGTPWLTLVSASVTWLLLSVMCPMPLCVFL